MLQGIGVLAVAGCMLVNVVDPYSGVTASQYFTVAIKDGADLPAQTLVVESVSAGVQRDSYGVSEPVQAVVAAASAGSAFAPPAAAPDPGSAQAYALSAVTSRGWGQGEYDCLVSLWNKESGWRYNAYNAGSGAYGIAQALPGSKMASAGADWATNANTQVDWGLGYITARYGTPCGAWSHSGSVGWY
jgi:hypothetical protein